MAKFAAAIIALFCLFTLSLARSPAENDESTTAVSFPLSETRPMLREAANAESESKSAAVTSAPLTKITIRPVNRRFRVGSKDPCRHHFRFYSTLRGNEEIPFGNDMILSSGENGDFVNPALRGEGQPINGRVRLHHHHHHHEDEDSDSDDEEEHDRIKKAVFNRFDFNRFDREKKLKGLKKMRKHFRLQNEEEKEEGFMRRVRKFFDDFF
ncbi:hypothetical protein CDL12_06295 [Handroanthus impetiginosus]|uniref:Uncharacterized protein n=1 Tax=Handroanthus impetiginosus TaxID=429701 RepID=A0A2G9HU07_9LAMI|nr:hypothetical protein CDL12_06295 [Handroanthus impetiginosus]